MCKKKKKRDTKRKKKQQIEKRKNKEEKENKNAESMRVIYTGERERKKELLNKSNGFSSIEKLNWCIFLCKSVTLECKESC